MKTNLSSFQPILSGLVIGLFGLLIHTASAHAAGGFLVERDTAFGHGADSHINHRSQQENYGAEPTMEVRRSFGDRKAYFRIDVGGLDDLLPGADARSIRNPVLRLTVGENPNYTFRLYGLRNSSDADRVPTGDPATGGWLEDELAWNNAPANLGEGIQGTHASPTGNPSGSANLIGLFTLSDLSDGDVIELGANPVNAMIHEPTSGQTDFLTRFEDFLQGDDNGMVTFIMRRTSTAEPTSHFYSKENTSGMAPPTLSFELGEPVGPHWPVEAGLTFPTVRHNSVNVHWSAAFLNTDPTGHTPPSEVAGYRILLNAQELGAVDGTTLGYTVTGLDPETTYTVQVQAGDGTGNWSPPLSGTVTTRPEHPPAGWSEITTADGAGADAFVWRGRRDENWGDNPLLQLKNAGTSTQRKAYMRFDLGAGGLPVVNAELSLVIGEVAQSHSSSVDWTFEVWGLHHGHEAEPWNETEITWANAPGNDTSHGSALLEEEASLLGTFVVHGLGELGEVYAFSSPDLAEFLARHTTGLVTLIVSRRTTQTEGDSSAVHHFASKEHAQFAPPTLRLHLPHAFTPDWAQGGDIEVHVEETPLLITAPDTDITLDRLAVAGNPETGYPAAFHLDGIRLATVEGFHLQGLTRVNLNEVELAGPLRITGDDNRLVAYDSVFDDRLFIRGQGESPLGNSIEGGDLIFRQPMISLAPMDDFYDGPHTAFRSTDDGSWLFLDTVLAQEGTIFDIGGSIAFEGEMSGAAQFPGTGEVSFNGGYLPGDSTAVISFGGDVLLGEQNLLSLELGGREAGAEHDHLSVAGLLRFGGGLEVLLIDDFEPVAGDEFGLFNAGSWEGSFASLDLPALSAGLVWDAADLETQGLLRVVPRPQLSFENWLAARFDPIELQDPERTDPLADPGDFKISNLLRYAHGLDPLEPDRTLLPALDIRMPAGADLEYLTLTYRERTDAGDLTYTVTAGGDLAGTWLLLDEQHEIERVSLDDGLEQVTVRDAVPLTESSARFLKLRIDLLP